MNGKPWEDQPSVEINTSGRGGSIYFREGINTASFSWEFAMSPALALIFGTPQQHWAAQYPWAGERQVEIYDFVAREAARQKAKGSAYEIDLELGIITIFNGNYSAAKPARGTYRNVARDYGQKTEAGSPATPTAHERLEEQLHDHLSTDIRLQAAEMLHAQGKMAEAELAEFLAKQIRSLYLPTNGLGRALALSELHDGETVRQALLWASYNATECAPHCATLLLKLTNSAQEPFSDANRDMLNKLGRHNSSFDRQAAFDRLCALTKMNLDMTQTD